MRTQLRNDRTDVGDERERECECTPAVQSVEDRWCGESFIVGFGELHRQRFFRALVGKVRSRRNDDEHQDRDRDERAAERRPQHMRVPRRGAVGAEIRDIGRPARRAEQAGPVHRRRHDRHADEIGVHLHEREPRSEEFPARERRD